MAGSLGPTVFGHLPDALALFAALIVGSGRARDWVWVGAARRGRRALRVPGRPRSARPAHLRRAPRRPARRARARRGRRAAGAASSARYDWLAFGAPWRLSYRYTSNIFTSQQQQNLFGVGLPTGHGIWTLLLDGHGLLLVSPVLVIAVAGLVLFRRRQRLEATVAAVIALVFAVYTAGYFLPNGGLSPGPRFATAALPFLLLGLPFALARWRVVDARPRRVLDRRRALRRAHLVGGEQAPVQGLAGDGLVARSGSRARAATLLIARLRRRAAGLVARSLVRKGCYGTRAPDPPFNSTPLNRPSEAGKELE